MSRSPQAAVAALLMASLLPTQALGRQKLPEIVSATTVNEGKAVVVIIEADGALPMPTPGSAENPPRLFFDFAGVKSKRRGVFTAPGLGIVRQTRIALNTLNVTRVVIDLERDQSYRMDVDDRGKGRIKILVGTLDGPAPTQEPAPVEPVKPAAGTPSPPVVRAPVEPAPEAPRRPSPVPPPPRVSETPPVRHAPPAPIAPRQRPVYTPPPSAPKPPQREAQRYRSALSGVIGRLEAQQPIVVLIDAEGSISTEALQAAMSEFTSVRRVLEGIKPNAAMAGTHELLIAYCTLGATASKLGLDAARDRSADVRKNAASAAAGALMFFDRACAAEIGCTKPQH